MGRLCRASKGRIRSWEVPSPGVLGGTYAALPFEENTLEANTCAASAPCLVPAGALSTQQLSFLWPTEQGAQVRMSMDGALKSRGSWVRGLALAPCDARPSFFLSVAWGSV